MPMNLPESARLVASREAVVQAYDRLADEINDHYGDEPVLMLVVMKGGMFAAVEIAQRLSVSLTIDYMHVSRYRGKTRGDSLHWITRPQHDLANRNVLIVDDILDEGPTLGAIVQYCLDAGAASVKTAVLVEKRHDRRIPGINADFVGIEVPDLYVFGCGMDYRDELRQLPAIYAIDG